MSDVRKPTRSKSLDPALDNMSDVRKPNKRPAKAQHASDEPPVDASLPSSAKIETVDVQQSSFTTFVYDSMTWPRWVWILIVMALLFVVWIVAAVWQWIILTLSLLLIGLFISWGILIYRHYRHEWSESPTATATAVTSVTRTTTTRQNGHDCHQCHTTFACRSKSSHSDTVNPRCCIEPGFDQAFCSWACCKAYEVAQGRLHVVPVPIPISRSAAKTVADASVFDIDIPDIVFNDLPTTRPE